MRNRPNSFLNVLYLLIIMAAPWFIVRQLYIVDTDTMSHFRNIIALVMIVVGVLSIPVGLLEIYLNLRSFISNKDIDLSYFISEIQYKRIVKHRKKIERKRFDDYIKNELSKV